MLKSRADSKLNQSSCFSALQRYVLYGPEFIENTTLANDELMSLTSEELLGKVRGLLGCQHEVIYYGPASEAEVVKMIEDGHGVSDDLKPLERTYSSRRLTPESNVFMVQYDAKQIYYLQCSNRGEKLDLAADPYITMYNEYFGGGMNAIVFQEMREARGLAYSSQAHLIGPSHKNDTYMYFAFIATQNDKMKTAIEAFDEIINQMPESQAAFDVAKEALISRMRTDRVTGTEIINNYIGDREMGVSESRMKHIYEIAQTMTLDDVKATQDKWVENRTYSYGILGDIKDLDTEYLKTLGPVKVLSLEEIFGY
jgi:predicted Zn-dependent peptidase